MVIFNCQNPTRWWGKPNETPFSTRIFWWFTVLKVYRVNHIVDHVQNMYMYHYVSMYTYIYNTVYIYRYLPEYPHEYLNIPRMIVNSMAFWPGHGRWCGYFVWHPRPLHAAGRVGVVSGAASSPRAARQWWKWKELPNKYGWIYKCGFDGIRYDVYVYIYTYIHVHVFSQYLYIYIL